MSPLEETTFTSPVNYSKPETGLVIVVDVLVRERVLLHVWSDAKDILIQCNRLAVYFLKASVSVSGPEQMQFLWMSMSLLCGIFGWHSKTEISPDSLRPGLVQLCSSLTGLSVRYGTLYCIWRWIIVATA